ncbi:jerky protein homolog [Bacillus rossius redtenbacheri]|uniref:jerky protein homolog n=1 Tax=Bacillus rossius redtenbacheri TaxID=93214 RepID=UPI002FDD1474
MFLKHSMSSSSCNRPYKRKHVTLTIQQKLDIIDRLEKGENRSAIMSCFNIGSSTIYDIRKQKEELEKFAAQGLTPKNTESRHTLKKPRLEILDSAVFAWFSAKLSQGKTVTGPMIIEKAKQLHRDMNMGSSCVFSDGWLKKFKIRHGIQRLDGAGESRPADGNPAEDYKNTFCGLIVRWELTPCQVYNAQVTGLLWRCLPTSALVGENEKCAAAFDRNKDRLTVLLCANASGDHQLTPFVIGKYKKPRALKEAPNLPVHYDAQSDACMTADLFKDWFFHHFVPQVKEDFRKRGMPENSRAILLLDNCTAHPPAAYLVSGNISADYLPPNVTPSIQPMDQGVMQDFKCFYRMCFLQGLLDCDCDVKNFQKHFNVKDAIFAIALAWSQVKESTLQRCWRKLWPSDEDADRDLDVSSDCQNMVLDLVDAVPDNPLTDVPRDEVLDWIEVDKCVPVAEELSVEQIIQRGINPQEAQVQEVESDEEEGAVVEDDKVSWKHASDALNTFIKFAESSESYVSAELLNLCIIRNDFWKKRSESQAQRDIGHFLKQ